MSVILEQIGLHMKNCFPCQQILARDQINFAEGMGTPSLSAILTLAVITIKSAPIAIGREPDLFERRKALDLKIIAAVFHFRGMWTQTKRGRLQNHHHYLTLALFGIFYRETSGQVGRRLSGAYEREKVKRRTHCRSVQKAAIKKSIRMAVKYLCYLA